MEQWVIVWFGFDSMCMDSCRVCGLTWNAAIFPERSRFQGSQAVLQLLGSQWLQVVQLLAVVSALSCEVIPGRLRDRETGVPCSNFTG